MKHLSHLQVDIMRVLWERGEASVADVQAELTQSRSLASTTVATMLTRLEKDGIVEHYTQGRHFVYKPRVSEGDARRSMVSDLIQRLFKGDSLELVDHLLKESEIAPGDLQHVRRILREKEEEK